MGQPDVGPAELEKERELAVALGKARDSADCQSLSQGRFLIGQRKLLCLEPPVLILTHVTYFTLYCPEEQ